MGYYNPKDGLDCIWLVNEDGEYEQTADRKFLLKYFDIERLSREKRFLAEEDVGCEGYSFQVLWNDSMVGRPSMPMKVQKRLDKRTIEAYCRPS